MRNGIIIVFVGMVLAFTGFRAVKTHFVCPVCGTHFKVGVLNYILTIHWFAKRMVKCPNCGTVELMIPEWDEKKF